MALYRGCGIFCLNGPLEAREAPTAILLRHADDPVFEVLVNAGPSRRLALMGAIEFVGGELTLPPENGLTLIIDHVEV